MRRARIHREAKPHRREPAAVRRLIALAAAFVLLPALTVLALVSATISVDGDMTDWEGVLGSPGNAISDPVDLADPDLPPTANRDLNLVGATWDDSSLYLYLRRTTSGKNAVEYLAYIDRDGDGLMSAEDMVLDLSFNGSSYKSGNSGLYAYVPAHPPGDPLNGDGMRMPGTVGALIPAEFTAASNSDGIRVEASLSWASLGLSPGSPIGLKFSASRNLNLPDGIDDNTNPLSLLYRGVSLTPDRFGGALAGETITYEHTLRNAGNASETLALSAISSAGWPVEVLGPTGSPMPSVTLAPSEATTVTVRIQVPADAADDSRDITELRAVCVEDTSVSASVRDATSVGPVVVIPDRTGSMAPGGTIEYRNQICNNSSVPLTLLLSSSSSQGWDTEIGDEAGAGTIERMTLDGGAIGWVTVRVSVPATATIGTQDVTTVRAVEETDPSIRGTGYDSTTVRLKLELWPDRAGPAGPGTHVTYLHTVRNSWSETKTVSLTASSSEGWSTGVYAADGVTPITSLEVGPYGATKDFKVRVRVPSGASPGTIDSTTVRAWWGAAVATVYDNTTVSLLATYRDGSFGIPADHFFVGDRVYVRGAGLSYGSSVRFRWLDPYGTEMWTSPPIGVDVNGMASDSYDLPDTAAIGTWRCLLLDDGGTELASQDFTVTFDASITHLYVADAPSAGTTLTPSTTLENRSAVDITASALEHLLWWDADSSGSLTPGDTCIDDAGTPVIYASGDVFTHTAGVGMVAKTSTTLSDWSFNSASLPFSGTWNLSARWRTDSGVTIDTEETTFRSSLVGLTMSIQTPDPSQSVAFGGLDPQQLATRQVYVNVSSISDYTMSRDVIGDHDLMGLVIVGDAVGFKPAGLGSYDEEYRVSIPWTTQPLTPLNAAVVYTVVQ